jgi:hypothetical protein
MNPFKHFFIANVSAKTFFPKNGIKKSNFSFFLPQRFAFKGLKWKKDFPKRILSRQKSFAFIARALYHLADLKVFGDELLQTYPNFNSSRENSSGVCLRTFCLFF